MTAIYFDSSAVLKLVLEEDESAAPRQWLEARPDGELAASGVGQSVLLGGPTICRGAGLVSSAQDLHVAVAAVVAG
jgi:hypothetical protein